jgi:putative DNA primase/helicase
MTIDANDIARAHGSARLAGMFDRSATLPPVVSLDGYGPLHQARDAPRIYDADEFLALSLPRREHIIDPVLPTRGLAMLYGPRGLGKSHLALLLAFAAACGEKALSNWQAPTSRKVLYVDGEMPAQAMQERLASIGRGSPKKPLPDALRFLCADLLDGPVPDLAVPDNQEWLERSWGSQPDLLILDNLSALTGAARDNEADAWTPMQRWLLSLRRKGVSVLFVHHAGKGGQQRGTSRREDVLDTVIALRRPGDYSPREGARFEVHLEKARGPYGDAVAPFEAALVSEGAASRWTWKPLEDAQLARAATMFADKMSVRDVAEELGITKSTAGRLRKRALDEGMLTDV